MAETWREHERTWRATGDQEALQRAMAARRRARLPLTLRLLEGRILPERTFSSELRMDVWAVRMYGPRPRTPLGTTGAGEPPVRIPPCAEWGVTPRCELGPALAEVEEREVPGLSLDRQRLTPRQFDLLGRLSELRYLSLAAASGLRLGALSGLRALEYLNLSRSGLRGEELAPLAELPELVCLDLRDCWGWGHGDVVALERLRTLDGLDLQGSPWLGDAEVSLLASMPELTHLNLVRCGQLTDTALRSLAGAGRLQALRLSGRPGLTDAGIASLAACEDLGVLRLQAFSRLAPEVLHALPPIRRLGLPRTASDAWLPALERLPQLTNLDLSHGTWPPTPGALEAALRALPRLTALGLVGNLARGRAPERARILQALVASAPQLETLDLSGNRMDEADAALVAELRALEVLVLSNNQLTNPCLHFLAKMPRLRWLHVTGNPDLTLEAVTGFRAARPDCVLVDGDLRA